MPAIQRFVEQKRSLKARDTKNVLSKHLIEYYPDISNDLHNLQLCVFATLRTPIEIKTMVKEGQIIDRFRPQLNRRFE